MSGPNGDPSISIDDGAISDEDDVGHEEYEAINSMLDQINSYLDDLEERNDSLNGKLHDLMESNRQARLEFRAQLTGPEGQEQDFPVDGEDSSSPSRDNVDEDSGAGKRVTSGVDEGDGVCTKTGM